MKLKLLCKLKFKGEPEANKKFEYLAEDVNIINIPEGTDPLKFKEFIEGFKFSIKEKYIEIITDYFDVELIEIKD